MQWQRAANDMVPVRRHFDDHTELKLIVRLALFPQIFNRINTSYCELELSPYW